MQTFSDANYSGCIGLRMSKRPGRRVKTGKANIQTGVFAEPIFIWKKVSASSLKPTIKIKRKKRKIKVLTA